MDIKTITSILNDVPAKYFVYAIILNTIITVFGALFYKLLFRIQGENLKFSRSFLILHMAQFLNFFAPLKTGAIFGKPLITKLIGNMPLTKSIFAVGFENFFSISWQLAMLPILLMLVGEKILLNSMLAKILIAVAALIAISTISRRYKWFLHYALGLKRFLPNKIKKIALRFGLDEAAIKELIENIPSYFSNKRMLLALILLTALQAFLQPFFLRWALAFFDVHMSYFSLFAIFWISYILGRMSFLPSGLGVKDLTIGGLLIGTKVNSIIAIKTVVLFRVLTFIPFLVIGGALFLYYGHKYTYKIFFKRDNST